MHTNKKKNVSAKLSLGAQDILMCKGNIIIIKLIDVWSNHVLNTFCKTLTYYSTLPFIRKWI